MDSLRAQSVGNKASEPPPERVEGLLDINVLPDRYKPRRISFTVVLAWLLLVVLVGLLYLSFQRFEAGTQQLAAQQLRFQTAQEALQAAEVQPAELEELQADIDSLIAQGDELEDVLSQVNIQWVQWGPLLADAAEMTPENVVLTALEQNDNEITLSGLASAYQDPIDYRDSLMASGLGAQVQLLSVTRVELDAEPAVVVATPTVESDEPEAAPIQQTDRFAYEFQLLLTLPEPSVATQSSEVTQ